MLKGHLPRVIYHQAYYHTKNTSTPFSRSSFARKADWSPCRVFRMSCFGFRVSGGGWRISSFGFRSGSGFGKLVLRVHGLELRVARFRSSEGRLVAVPCFQDALIECLGLSDEGLGFRVKGLGFGSLGVKIFEFGF